MLSAMDKEILAGGFPTSVVAIAFIVSMIRIIGSIAFK